MIKLENVTKVYAGGTEAVNNVSLEIGKGELCILVGPSGCGKTTTLRMINRLIALTSGTIYLDGRDISKIDPNQLRRGIGYAIQEIGLFPHMTVEHNVAAVPLLLGWPKEKWKSRVKELLELVGLTPPEEFGKRYPSELSGGQRQRVGVARCLGADPPVLLMDEPFGAIDPITRERLQDEFLRIQEEIQKTIVFVTHDLQEGLKLGDRIALMRDGYLIQEGTPAEILVEPKDDFVRNFVGTDRTLKALTLVRLREVLDENVPTIETEATVAQALQRMDERDVRFLPVVDQDGSFAGWVNRRGLRDLDGEQKVSDVLVPARMLGRRDMPVNEALSLMLESAIGNLAVVDRHDKFVGVLTFRRLYEVVQENYLEEGDQG